ncbi:MAG: S-methyl-5'-thioadenosine phosphorylase [Candidatus Hydrothermarchaeales archaeon]
MGKIAIIGGTGFKELGIAEEQETKTVDTPYGTSKVEFGTIGGKDVFFIARHGEKHKIPPHRVNYRANISALKILGIERIISINSVGAINENFKPGDVVIPNDFVDFSKNRPSTFYDDSTVHIDVSDPYCPEIRKVLIKAAERVCGNVFDGGVYLCTEGPRFETKAEIRMFRLLGCDVVGMVGLPEVVLAREKEMCYASICTVTNFGAGINKDKITISEVREIIAKNRDYMKEIILEAVTGIHEERGCDCKKALEDARA